MTRWLALANVIFGAVGVAVTIAGDADACMCMRMSRFKVVGPNGVDDAPRNSRVRIELAPSSWAPDEGEQLLLREHDGNPVAVSLHGPLPKTGPSQIIELQPRALLGAGKRYETVLLRPGKHPSQLILATFKTSASTDTTPPELDPLGNVSVGGLPPPPAPPGMVTVQISSSCGGDTPHVTIEHVASHDPMRPAAQMVYGVWLGDAKTGAIDASKPATGLFLAYDNGSLVIGPRSLCTMDFPFPTGVPSATLGVAAIDEAGNASKMRSFRVALQ